VRRPIHLPGAALLAALLAPAHAALSPTEIFAKISPSIWRVQTYDADGVPLKLGSAVVVAPDTLVTNCHVLKSAARVTVRHEQTRAEARLAMWDTERDVCRLVTTGLKAPAVSLRLSGTLLVGQPVYALGNPEGLDLTMSSGLLSSIRRNERGQVVLLQTSAAISGGSSGGGLFDDQGVLIGLTTLGSVTGDAQNLNFAIPVDWIKELPQRHARLSKPGAATTAAASAATVSTPPVARNASAGPCLGAGQQTGPVLPSDADVVDTSRLPYANEKMRESYRTFLTCPLPRAFAISEGGKWWYAWSTTPKDPTAPKDPSERALRSCEKSSGARCFLYAVDTRIVYGAASAPPK
jgi:S1-C subfamily serine protease